MFLGIKFASKKLIFACFVREKGMMVRERSRKSQGICI